jgi:chromate transporter
MNEQNQLLGIAQHFALLSLLTVGGVTAVLPEMHREAVELRHWMSDAEFASLFAIAQATPGPNMLVVTLVGWRVAGFAGGLVATAAMCVPTALLTFLTLSLWDRFKARPWRAAVQNGLTPIMVGLVAASAFLLTRSTSIGWATFAITIGTAILCCATRINPIWAMGVAAVLGMSGVLS